MGCTKFKGKWESIVHKFSFSKFQGESCISSWLLIRYYQLKDYLKLEDEKNCKQGDICCCISLIISFQSRKISTIWSSWLPRQRNITHKLLNKQCLANMVLLRFGDKWERKLLYRPVTAYLRLLFDHVLVLTGESTNFDSPWLQQVNNFTHYHYKWSVAWYNKYGNIT